MATKSPDPCAGVRPHFSARLDGELDPEIPWTTRFLVRFHLTICPQCRRMRRSLDATRDALAALRDVDVDVAADDLEPKPP